MSTSQGTSKVARKSPSDKDSHRMCPFLGVFRRDQACDTVYISDGHAAELWGQWSIIWSHSACGYLLWKSQEIYTNLTLSSQLSSSQSAKLKKQNKQTNKKPPQQLPCLSSLLIQPRLPTALVSNTPVPDPDLCFQKLLSFKTQLSLSFLHIFSCAKASVHEHPTTAHEFAHSVIETNTISVSLIRNLLIFKVVGTDFCQQFSLLLESLELACEQRIILQRLFCHSPASSAFLLHLSPREAGFCWLVGAQVSLGSRGQAGQGWPA